MEEKKNEELRKQLAEKKKILLAGVKDKHFGEKLLNDMLSLKGQLSVEPAHYYIGIDEVIDTYESDEYRIHILNNGVHFQTKGGFDIFIDAKYQAACGLLEDVVRFKNEEKDLSDEDKQVYATTLKNLMYVLCAPLWVLGSQSMTTFLGNALLVMLSAQSDWMSQEDDEKRKQPVPTLEIALKVKEMCDMLIVHINEQKNSKEEETKEEEVK